MRYKALVSETVDVSANTTFCCSGCGRKSFQVTLSKQVGAAYLNKNEFSEQGVDFVETSTVTGTRIAIRSDILTNLPRSSKLERISTANLIILDEDMLEVPDDLRKI